MMNPSRRSFLCRALSTGGLISFGGDAPQFLAAASETVTVQTDRKLIVLFLDGGNDGLNMVIPIRDPLYEKYRPDTRIRSASGIALDDDVSLHPAMRGLAEVWESGRLAILQGIGYPDHSRSHFASRAVWDAAQLDATLRANDGWLGRALDQRQTSADAPLTYSVGFAETPPALRGRKTRTAVPPDVSQDGARRIRELLCLHQDRQASSETRQHVAQAQRDAVGALDQLIAMRSPRPDGFPDTELGRQLSQVAWLVRSGTPACAYYVRQSGYDTHAGQPPRHAALLRELADALRAFDFAMDEAALSSRVTVMVYSEFGRRVAENESGGTDHGAAGPVLLMGGGYAPGIHGHKIDLENLDNGDVRVTTDFRNVYATLLQCSLHVDPSLVLPHEFQPLPQLQAFR